MVIELAGEGGELVVVHHHRESLGAVLPDERLDNGERLTGARRSDDPGPAERVHDVHPAVTELALVVVTHRDVHAVLVLDLLLTLFEGLVLEIEAVLQQSLLEELGYVVQGDMHQYGTHHRSGHVEPPVERNRVDARGKVMPEQPDGKDHDGETGDERVENHLTGIELQLLLVPCSYAGDADQKQGGHLAPDEVPFGIDEPPAHPAVDVSEDAAPEIQYPRVHRIQEELQQEGDVDEASEYLVADDKVLTFFHRYSSFRITAIRLT